MNILKAGFWLGEFGWQLMAWQAKLRYLAKNNHFDKIMIGCERGYEYLYSDFAHEYIYPNDVYIKYRNMWQCNSKTISLDSEDCITPNRNICMNDDYKSEFIKYGKRDNKLKYDILIHARSTCNFRTDYRNYPVKEWESVVKHFEGLKIACVGSEGGAYYINGTDNKRGIKLNKLADIMASSTVLLSPSSGPAHFASLCGLPHVVWSDIKKEPNCANNRERYAKTWNPFKTKNIFIESWQPHRWRIISECEKVLSNSDNNI